MATRENRPCACVILAAGEGKRMKSSRPKVAHRLAGRPLLLHVLEAARALAPDPTVVVAPSRKGPIVELAADAAEVAVQDAKLGTGDALGRAAPILKNFDGDVLVLCGDVPLLTPATLCRLLEVHRTRGWSATVLTAVVPDPSGYGRIVRRSDGELEAIVEDLDADGRTRAIREINSGIYCFVSPLIWEILRKIGSDNRQGEYYLTDAVRLLVEWGNPVGSCVVEDCREIQGINSRRQLAAAEADFQDRRRRACWKEGVTLIAPETVYLEVGAEIGADSEIGPFVHIGAGARVGAGCRLGPFVRVNPGQEVPAGTSLAGDPPAREVRE